MSSPDVIRWPTINWQPTSSQLARLASYAAATYREPHVLHKHSLLFLPPYDLADIPARLSCLTKNACLDKALTDLPDRPPLQPASSRWTDGAALPQPRELHSLRRVKRLGFGGFHYYRHSRWHQPVFSLLERSIHIYIRITKAGENEHVYKPPSSAISWRRGGDCREAAS